MTEQKTEQGHQRHNIVTALAELNAARDEDYGENTVLGQNRSPRLAVADMMSGS